MNIYFYAHLTKLLKYTPQVLLLETLRIHAISIIFRIIYQLKSQKILFQRDSTNNGNKVVQRNKLDTPPPKKNQFKNQTPSVWDDSESTCPHQHFTESKFTQANFAWYMPSLHAKGHCLKHHKRLSAFTES